MTPATTSYELDRGEAVLCVPVVLGCDSSKAFDAIGKALDEISLAVARCERA
ncbi:hypothetical protein HGG75_04575 [Ochrobactrum pseudogrignonense]|nr:hypothetical protein [Brucella pseudogrignonensis]